MDTKSLKKFIAISDKAPFWKERFIKYDFDIHSDDIVKELKKLTVLRKDEVKSNIDRIKTPLAEKEAITMNTSGTTGSGMTFPITRAMETDQWAVCWLYRNEHGLGLKDICAWFGGRSILNGNRKNPPYWIHNRFTNQIMFSAYPLNEETVEHYFEKIKSKKLKWIHGYPSQVAYFSSLVKEKVWVCYQTLK